MRLFSFLIPSTIFILPDKHIFKIVYATITIHVLHYIFLFIIITLTRSYFRRWYIKTDFGSKYSRAGKLIFQLHCAAIVIQIAIVDFFLKISWQNGVMFFQLFFFLLMEVFIFYFIQMVYVAVFKSESIDNEQW